jgi:hypothetical protein
MSAMKDHEGKRHVRGEEKRDDMLVLRLALRAGRPRSMAPLRNQRGARASRPHRRAVFLRLGYEYMVCVRRD